MAKLKIMEPLDQLLFKKLEELQSVREVQKVMDAYSNLDERPQELVKASMAALLIVTPILIISIFYGINSSLKSELDQKRELLSVSQNIINEKSGIQGAKRNFLGNSFVGSMNDMQDLIARSLTLAGIDASKASVSNFQADEKEGFITQASIDMKFKGLSNSEMFSLINSLSDRQKVRFDEITVNKNTATNLLEGVATLIYISKDNSTEF